MVLVVMGVSGAGKTTVGQELARQLECPFIEGDDHHPEANVDKMSRGIPLTDADREPWLTALHRIIHRHLSAGETAVVVCSALKESYRCRLAAQNSGVRFIYLKGSIELFRPRLQSRVDHYMKANLLASQFADLEEPLNALQVNASLPPAAIVKRILQHLTV
jgi:gluconokinase